MVNLVGAPSQTEGMVMGAVIFIGALVDQFLTNRRKKVVVVGRFGGRDMKMRV
jgi:hypothetical protein